MAKFAANTIVDIVLANQLVRYCILPAMPAFTPMNERINIATQCLRETYGEATDSWDIRVNPLPHGDSMLCCAADRLLIEELLTLATRHRLQLRSLQPSLMHGFNAARRQMRAEPACFVQLEPGRITLALIRDGAWQALASSLLCNNDLLSQQWQAQLVQMVSRELLLAGWPLDQNTALTLYIETSFIAGNAAYTARQHSTSPKKLPSTWQLVYLTPVHEHSIKRRAESEHQILTPHRERL